VSLGPIIWVRTLPHRTPGIWRALGLAVLWFVGCLIVFGIGYGVVVSIFGPLRALAAGPVRATIPVCTTGS
jgi:hypothetical protein